MHRYNLKHLPDAKLLSRLTTLIARERRMTARVIAHLAEVDERKLYAGEGYPSMYAFCIGKLGFSEDAAYKRIQVARAAQEHPALLPALECGRLHVGAVRLLVPHLTAVNAAKLMDAASNLSCEKVKAMLARRFPRPEELMLEEIAPAVREIPCVSAEPTAELAT